MVPDTLSKTPVAECLIFLMVMWGYCRFWECLEFFYIHTREKNKNKNTLSYSAVHAPKTLITPNSARQADIWPAGHSQKDPISRAESPGLGRNGILRGGSNGDR